MCGVMKIEKKMLYWKFRFVYSQQIWWTTFIGFHKKNEKGKEKVVFQGEGIQKVVLQLPYTWGYVDSINRIRRSKLKVVLVVGAGGNQKAIKVEVWGEFFLFLMSLILEKYFLRGNPIKSNETRPKKSVCTTGLDGSHKPIL